MRQILACLAALGVAEAASAGAVVQTETRQMVGEYQERFLFLGFDSNVRERDCEAMLL